MSESDKIDPPTRQVTDDQAAAEMQAAAARRPRSAYVMVGFPVVFLASEAHRTKTLRGGETLDGSVFHPELVEFAGTIGRLNDDGTADIALIIPGHSDLRWVENVPEGEDPGSFRPISG